MEKYHLIHELGSGSFGVVWKALNKKTGEIVAIKKLKSWSNKRMIKREIKSLVVNRHVNIVTLKELINENNIIFLVFECMQSSLYYLMVNRYRMKAPFLEQEIRDACFQIFQGLACMHRNGYIHRDLKPENLLVSENLVKISDLGSSGSTNDHLPYTHNVTTIWYRAPEVFLHSKVYDSAVDMWAMGAIMAELFTFQPLFKGCSDADVMQKICSVLGTPTDSSWSDGLQLARNMKYQFPEFAGVRFSELLPTASPAAVNLISSLLSWSPCARPTAKEALKHPFFHGCYHVPRTVRVEGTDLSLPVVFKLALVRELLKKKSNLKSCANTNTSDNLIRMLPENPFEFMT